MLLDWSSVDKAMLLTGVPLPMLIAAFVRVSFLLSDPTDEPYLSRLILHDIQVAIAVYVSGTAALALAWWRLRRTNPTSRPFVQSCLFALFITVAISAYFVGHFSTPIMGGVVACTIAVLLLFDTDIARPAVIFGFATLFGPVPFMALRILPYSPLYARSPFIGAEPPINWLLTSGFFSVVIVIVPISILMTVLERWRVRDAEVQRLVRLDGLTEIPNRRYFLERLESEIARATRYESSVALLLLDLDNFKRINDKFGHQHGDRALRHVASVLTSDVVRRIDVIGRYGGEEFAVMLPETDFAGAMLVAERIRAALASTPVVLGDTANVSLTTSIGVAVYPSEFVASLDALVSRADGALYHAKDAGRNRVESEPLIDRISGVD